MRNGLYNICVKIVGEKKAVECMLQPEAFRRREGCFGSQRALQMRNKMPPYQWWGANVCEEEAGELKTVALKVRLAALSPMREADQHVEISMEPECMLELRVKHGGCRFSLWLGAQVDARGTGLHMISSQIASATSWTPRVPSSWCMYTTTGAAY